MAMSLINKVFNMKIFINILRAAFNLASVKKEVVNCNYPNNYYGDQYCQTQVK